jgi:hypothetical protein
MARPLFFALVIVAPTSLFGVGCRDAPTASTNAGAAVSATASASAAPLPPDHLLPGELAEGKETAFGVVLPRGFTVERRFEDAIHFTGQASAEHVSAYLRRRITVSTVEVGPSRTIFASARSRTGLPVTVEITDRGGYVDLVVRNLTPPPVPAGLSEAERWQRTGLKPNGEPLDPNNTY